MSKNKKRLFRNKKKTEETTPTVQYENIPVQQPQTIYIPPEPIPQPPIAPPPPQTYRPFNLMEYLLHDNTQVSHISINNIKEGQIQIFLDKELDPIVITLPKPLAQALRMAYRAGLNDAEKMQGKGTPNKIVNFPTKTDEEKAIIETAVDMAEFLSRLGACHGKTEQDLIDAVKEYKVQEAKRRNENG